MHLSVDDTGLRQGIIAVERLRTYGKKMFVPDRHLDRWSRTTKALFIDGLPSGDDLRQILEQLLSRNQSYVDRNGDVGITMVATPGVTPDTPTLAIHLNKIDHAVVASRRASGQPIVVTPVVQPPNESWSRDIKVRSRIHYYHADRIARAKHPEAIGVLIDADGSITETSTSNIAILVDGEIISPPKDRVLGGVTQSVVEEIAASEKLAWRYRPISPGELKRADEVWLMGTTGGIWFASQIDNDERRAESMSVYAKLLVKFDRLTESG